MDELEQRIPLSLAGERCPVAVGEHYASCSCGRMPNAGTGGNQVRQHVTPQMHLRGFADGGMVNRRGADGQIQRRVPIKSVAAEQHMYSRPGADGEPDRLVEDLLGGVEWIARPIRDRVCAGYPICDTDKQWFAAYLGLLRMRTASMRPAILGVIEQQLAQDGLPADGLVDDLNAMITTPDGETDLRSGVLHLMVEWGLGALGRQFHESEWNVQRVAAYLLVTSREPVAHLVPEEGGDCILVALNHEVALFISPVGMPLRLPLDGGEINWLTTRSHDEVLWHPHREEPLITPPTWAPQVTFERGAVPRVT